MLSSLSPLYSISLTCPGDAIRLLVEYFLDAQMEAEGADYMLVTPSPLKVPPTFKEDLLVSINLVLVIQSLTGTPPRDLFPKQFYIPSG